MDILNNLPARLFTGLRARITEEEDGFRVSVQMHNNRNPEDDAWGFKTAASIEMASEMIAGLAQRYSIPQKSISINIVMNDFRQNTLH